jgi:hypothetical protein
MVTGLIEGNGGCNLPCWWGISPGATTLQDALGLLSRIDPGIVDRVPSGESAFWLEASTPVPPEYTVREVLSQWFLVDSGIITMMNAQPGASGKYQLSTFVADTGIPTMSWIRVDLGIESPSGNVSTVLLVYYQHRGLVAKYSQIGKLDRSKELLNVCYFEEPMDSMYLWHPKPVDEIESIMIENDIATVGTREFVELSTATGKPETEQWNSLVSGSQLCMEIQAKPWLPIP